MHASRWFAVGQAGGAERQPGLVAAEQALVCDDAKLLIVFCSDALDLADVVSEISACSGGVPLVGCSTAGEIATAGPGDASVVVTALGGEGFSVATSAVEGASRDLRGAGAKAAGCFASVEDRPHRLLLLADGSQRGGHGLETAAAGRRQRPGRVPSALQSSQDRCGEDIGARGPPRRPPRTLAYSPARKRHSG